MAIVMARRPNFHGAYFTLAEVAAELKTTPADLLASACVGELRLFVRVPDGVNVHAVHADAVDLADEQAKTWRFIRRIPEPDPAECCPINMAASGVEGLMLSQGNCQQVRDKKAVREYLFLQGCKVNMSMIEYVEPMSGHFRYLKKPTLSKEGWRLAVYPKTGKVIQYFPGTGYSQPLGVELSIDRLFVAAPDLRRFIDGLDINIFVADLVAGNHFARELPDYICKKLRFLADLSETVWAGVYPEDREAIKKANDETYRRVFSKDFASYFLKGEASKGVKIAATELVEPVFARKNRSDDDLASYPGHISPEMKILFAGAKWFWGAPSVRIDRPVTHPHASGIKEFFRMHGLDKDVSSYCATLIRPEDAQRGSPVEKESGVQKVLNRLRADMLSKRESQ